MLYLELTEELKKKIEQITCTDYDFKGIFLPAHNADLLIRDLLVEIDNLNQQIENEENNIKDNYRPISKSEQYDVNNKMFI